MRRAGRTRDVPEGQLASALSMCGWTEDCAAIGQNQFEVEVGHVPARRRYSNAPSGSALPMTRCPRKRLRTDVVTMCR